MVRVGIHNPSPTKQVTKDLYRLGHTGTSLNIAFCWRPSTNLATVPVALALASEVVLGHRAQVWVLASEVVLGHRAQVWVLAPEVVLGHRAQVWVLASELVLGHYAQVWVLD